MSSKAFLSHLESFVTENRKELFHKIIEYRTRYITVVLEDIFQPHNASAVLRTCDCFGIQDVHIIENRNKYKVNPDVALGSDKWLTLKKYRNARQNSIKAIEGLKKKSYRIVATSPHKKGVDVNNFDIAAGKFALVFGTELQGLTPDILDRADEFISIPMFGFTESFNISVSAAIILHTLVVRLHESGIDWKMKPDEKNKVLISWFKTSVKRSDLIEKSFRLGKGCL